MSQDPDVAKAGHRLVTLAAKPGPVAMVLSATAAPVVDMQNDFGWVSDSNELLRKLEGIGAPT